MTNHLNRIVYLASATALVAVIAFSTGAKAETSLQGSSLSAVAVTADFDPLCGHHYEVDNFDPLCGHHYAI